MDIIYRHKKLFSRSLFSIIILCIDKALTLIISVLILFRLKICLPVQFGFYRLQQAVQLG
jgi:hypothetical protein